MNIPLVDLKSQYLSIKNEIDAAVQDVINSSAFILGKAVHDFEDAFAKAHNVKHCIAVGSGTDALHAALWAMGITAGDEVVTVPYTFIATVEAISLTGAKPVFVDIEPNTYSMDPAKIEKVITPKTKAIIPVHLYGHPAMMDKISEIARRHKLILIEDAAQAHLAKFQSKFVGEFGAATCFSFYPGKNLGAYGEAGAIITDDDALAKKLCQLRDHGQVEKYNHAFWGHNYRMDGIQGAVLGVKLNYLQTWTDRRRSIANLYRKLLTGIGDLIMPFELPGSYHVYHLFVLRTKLRDTLQKFLSEKGISTGLHYPKPLHLQLAYSHLDYKAGDFPISEICAQECLSLPIYPELTDIQVNHIAEEVKKFYKSGKK
jgi:dTDP-4-amino-4,6-dideoxygalactose transaminase